MRLRLATSIIIVGLLCFVTTFHLKVLYSSKAFVAFGAVLGIIFMQIFHSFGKFYPKIQKAYLIFSINNSCFMRNSILVIDGINLGLISAMDLSVAYNTWFEFDIFRYFPVFSHCLIHFFALWTIYLIEINKILREIFVFFYDPSVKEIEVTEHAISWIAIAVLSDFVAYFAMIYIGVFASLIYFIYKLVNWSPLYAFIGFIAFCFLNCMINMCRYYIMKYRLITYHRELHRISEEMIEI